MSDRDLQAEHSAIDVLAQVLRGIDPANRPLQWRIWELQLLDRISLMDKRAKG